MREVSTLYILADDEYPMPDNEQRLQYLDQPELEFVAYKDAILHRKEQRKHREKRKRLNALSRNRNGSEA